MPKLRHYDHLGTARFVTFSCYNRQQLLTNLVARETVLAELSRLRGVYRIRLLGYVIMPEHVHLVLLPPDDLRLGPTIGVFKTRSAHTILSWMRSDPQHAWWIQRRASGGAAVWERRCYDHNCRTPEIVIEKIKYCHDNPVKRGLADRPEDWQWSSCRWYLGQREGVLEIDGIEL
ncbi:MAG: transposase [Candidatus Zixiibacteriota bacterium]